MSFVSCAIAESFLDKYFGAVLCTNCAFVISTEGRNLIAVCNKISCSTLPDKKNSVYDQGSIGVQYKKLPRFANAFLFVRGFF